MKHLPAMAALLLCAQLSFGSGISPLRPKRIPANIYSWLTYPGNVLVYSDPGARQVPLVARISIPTPGQVYDFSAAPKVYWINWPAGAVATYELSVATNVAATAIDDVTVPGGRIVMLEYTGPSLVYSFTIEAGRQYEIEATF